MKTLYQTFNIYNIHEAQMNETIIAIVNSEMQVQTQTLHTSNFFSLEFNLMQIIRILWYIFCIFKVLSIAFSSKHKPSIKERVLRKFFFSHSQLLKFFTEEDKVKMQQLVDNTIKNASTLYQTNTSRIRRSNKKVNFIVENNEYFEPHQRRQDALNFLIPLFEFSKPVQQLGIDQNPTFQQKKHNEQFVERQDLFQQDEKASDFDEEQSSLTELANAQAIEISNTGESQDIENSLI